MPKTPEKLISDLNETLLSATTVTAALELWCQERGFKRVNLIAKKISNVSCPITNLQKHRLDIQPNDILEFRQVDLIYGSKVLVRANNWYVASRLNKGMNRLLDTSDIPFGRIIMPLNPRRETFSVKTLKDYSKLSPENMDEVIILQHEALILSGAGSPIAEVSEFYTQHLLEGCE